MTTKTSNATPKPAVKELPETRIARLVTQRLAQGFTSKAIAHQVVLLIAQIEKGN